jgi:hypothetical protein
MEPQNVNPSNFTVDKIIYNDNEFSIAFGTWADNSKVVGMRWNGDGDNSLGYPNVFGKPMWFVIPTDLARQFIATLLGNDFSENQLIIDTLNELYK